VRRAPPVAAVGLIAVGLALVAMAQAGRQRAAAVPEREGRAHARAREHEPAGSSAATALREGRPMDLNAATEADLVLLPRIGPALAARIVEHRLAQGPFASVAELGRVRGIGPRTVAALEPLLVVQARDGARAARLAPEPPVR